MRILPLYDDTTTAWVAVRVDDLIDGSVVSRPHELSGAVEPGVVSSRWLSDGHLPFHSVAFTARRDAFLDAWCYPALVAAEDVGLVLAVTDRYRGVVLKDTLAQYRKWSLQTTVASVPYADLRPLCIQLLADTVRARRPRRS